MDENVSSFREPPGIEASAQTAKDRSDGSYRFVDAMQAARRQARPDPGPAVELHLSPTAREYARHADRDGGQKRKTKRSAYPPRTRGTSEPPGASAPGVDGSHSDD